MELPNLYKGFLYLYLCIKLKFARTDASMVMQREKDTVIETVYWLESASSCSTPSKGKDGHEKFNFVQFCDLFQYYFD